MTATDRLLSVALAEEGYLEKRSNAQLDHKTANAGDKNFTKYARDLDALNVYNGKKQGFPWCDVFVDWCFLTAFGVELGLKLLCQPKGSCGAGVKYSADYYRKAGRFVDTPQPGDQVFFASKGSMLHTGIVEKVEGGKVYTIEGNTSGASGVVANGGGVCRKVYPIASAGIAGYGRPDWSLALQEDKTPWYAEAQAWAKETGIADGARPTDPATRAEVWTMLKRMKERM